MEYLPGEIVENIFNPLCVYDKTQCRLVCKLWEELLRDIKFWNGHYVAYMENFRQRLYQDFKDCMTEWIQIYNTRGIEFSTMIMCGIYKDALMSEFVVENTLRIAIQVGNIHSAKFIYYFFKEHDKKKLKMLFMDPHRLLKLSCMSGSKEMYKFISSICEFGLDKMNYIEDIFRWLCNTSTSRGWSSKPLSWLIKTYKIEKNDHIVESIIILFINKKYAEAKLLINKLDINTNNLLESRAFENANISIKTSILENL
jgi:hypothetical protein